MDTIPTEGFDAALTLTDPLDHLPAAKRRELARVLEIIFAEVEQFRATKLSAKRANSQVLKVILYGSYARGDWVEDRSSGYRSDYDILVIVNSEAFAQEQELWLSLDERLLQEQIAHRIETPVIPIVHSLHDVNDQLSRGRPFFVDIARDGKVLYEEEGHPLAHPRPLTMEEAKAEAQKNFERWYQLSQEALVGAELMLERNIWRHGAFMLHQAVEEAYHCLLLTLTLYSPKSHRIKVLRSKAEDLDKRLVDAWPRDNRMARRRFELLSRAYVEARYSPNYAITTEELGWLAERVRALQAAVASICEERLLGLPPSEGDGTLPKN
ncbi:putative nucleotidyltransferase/HEPN domain-containing protein [Rhizobium sp. BK275]|uniref:HEPN domain-containing protein n=1 Tax=unclassified Rhizobium TaxID=2613769 RepID=UPI001613638C|nr:MULTISPECIES: HEPN domain-containing protein [unclassified Rhizobium]MBB3388418.1 putative nucleotidyltransferase/HEPN domain-containing protein [Rhizobium sp. BK275]MBB3407773.1 putative nucleotidyltransferase/HEPN domain-containing protein [Rhizobium sp. BK316]